MFFLQLYNYLLFHSLIESFAVMVAVSIFVFSWNTRKFIDTDFFLFLGVGFLFVGLMDLLHTLAYSGMGVFGAGPNLATQLWVQARYLQSITLLMALIFVNKKINNHLIFFLYTLVTALGLLSIFYWENFPVCFIEGYGLTAFKIISEYIIVIIFFFSLILLLERSRIFSKGVRRSLIASTVIIILAELSFTLYTDVYGIANMVGHFFKVISFYLIYQAIVINCLLEPYSNMFRSLKKSEHDYRFIVENQSELVDRLDADGKILFVSPSYCRFYGKKAKDLLGKNFLAVVEEKDRQKVEESIERLNYPPHESVSIQEVKRGNETRWIEWRNKAVLGKDGKITSIIGTGRDITKQKKAEDTARYLAFHDRLTGLYSREYFDEELKRLDTVRQLPISIIIGDVNGLKIINNTFGNRRGDKILLKIAGIFKDSLRDEDIVARWGGDEFAAILPRTEMKKGLEIIDRIKENCRTDSGKSIALSISLGIATKEDKGQSISEVIKKAEENMHREKLANGKSARSSIISSLVKTLRERDYEAEEHADRIKKMCMILGKKLELPDTELVILSLLSTLHDIGKLSIPDHIIFKPGPLTEKEWKIMERHPEIGHKIANSSDELAPIAEGILSHHERWDGKGYPRGIEGSRIPAVARILSVVDAYDAMTHNRPYRGAMEKGKAIKELKRCSGTQFDPKVVKAFLEFLKENGRI